MPLSRLEKRLNAPRTERHVVTMTQSERENRKPSSFFLFWFRSDPARRAPRKRDTNLQRFGHLARPGPDGTPKGIGFETGFEAGFVFACAVDFPFKNEIARSLSPRGRVLTSFGSRKYFVEVTVPAPAILIGHA